LSSKSSTKEKKKTFIEASHPRWMVLSRLNLQGPCSWSRKPFSKLSAQSTDLERLDLPVQVTNPVYPSYKGYRITVIFWTLEFAFM
jgi:hypothetical protein